MGPQDIDDAARLKALEPHISNICRAGGAPGLSLAVLHHGAVVYSKHFGCRDVETEEPPNGDTVYFIGSLTKAMVSALVGICVEAGLLEWTTPICSILPELVDTFQGRGSQLTALDLLSHRVGVSRGDAPWLQRAGNILMPKSKGIDTWTSLPLVRDFRTDYLYSNFGYDIAGRAIEKLTGMSLGENLRSKIFEPLGMTRTSLQDDFSDGSNYAKAYFALDDASPFQVPIPTISDKTLMAAAGSVRSCTNDLARFYASFLHAVNDQFLNKTTSTAVSPFKQLVRILQPHSQLTMVSLREQSYALGWGRAQLPCVLGAFNYNKYLVPQMPVIGKDAPSRLAVYHGGSMQGFTSSVYLLPETETAIIALQNSTGLCDPCDWIAQLAIETIFGTKQLPESFEKLAKNAAATGAGLAAAIDRKLQQERKPGTQPYWNKVKIFRIDITVCKRGEAEELYTCFQGMENETYRLRHYHHDVFVWNVSHNDTARQGRFQTRPFYSYKIQFELDAVDEGEQTAEVKAKGLRWMYDDLPEPGTFVLEQDLGTLRGLAGVDSRVPD